MYDESNYTDHLCDVRRNAERAAYDFQTGYIGSEHVVFGMFAVPDCTAAKLLNEAGARAERYAEQFRLSISHQPYEPDYTPRCKRIFDLGLELALEHSGDYPLVGTEHVLLATLMTENCIGADLLRRIGTDMDLLEKRLGEFIERDPSERPKPTPKKDRAAPSPSSSPFKPSSYRDLLSAYKSPEKEEDKPYLAYGTDLTKRAREGKLDPVIGRKKEIDKVIQILSRRTKNNPVLIGEAGVGKSAVVEGLALAIVKGEVPELLNGKTVFSLNLTGLLAGTKYRGDFEERLQMVIDAVSADRSIILFIDEIHMLVGAGSSMESGMDASNILKPMLARGELQTVGATTTEEYRKYIEKDAALARRFTPVVVEQPTVDDAIVILRGLKDKYEAHHSVIITDEAIEAAVKLSDRYVNDRCLPDKAIDLIDEAASRARLNSYNGPAELRALEDRLVRLNASLGRARKWGDDSLSAQLSEELERTTARCAELRRDWEGKRNTARLSIGTEDIAEIVSDWTGVPVSRLTEEESERLLHLEEELHRRIVGQNEAVRAVSLAIRRARAGLADPGKPIGSFIFVGPTGVGKTDLAKALAESMFGDERMMIRLDMSEFMDKSSVTKIIGAPPGYVGFNDTSGSLTERVRRNPYSVVLFDEIEKAHPDIFNVLLQILDDGRLSDSRGRVVSFKNTVLILTSNIGAHEVKEVSALGFGQETGAYEGMKDRIESALKTYFRPEFLNRIDDIVIFRKLTREDAELICEKMLASLSERLQEKQVTLRVTERAKSRLVDEGYSEEFGARPLKRTIRREVEDRLSEELLKNGSASGEYLLDATEEGFVILTGS